MPKVAEDATRRHARARARRVRSPGSTGNTGAEPRGIRPGRPRSQKADEAILNAALRLFMERGFADTSVEAVAEISGVAKTTTYRRYGTKVELVTAAIAEFVRVSDIPDTGSLRGDLLSFVSKAALELFKGPGSAMVGTFLAEKDRNPELIETFRRRLVEPRRRQMHAIFERAVARGELDPGADYHLAAQALIGMMLARVVSGAPIDRRVGAAAVDLLLNGLRPRS